MIINYFYIFVAFLLLLDLINLVIIINTHAYIHDNLAADPY
jgi:hypothetical protein